MRFETVRSVATGLAVGAMVAGAAAGVLAQGGLTGAVFTTNANGSFVNGNVYDDRSEPYLNGGPRANAVCTAAGLPNGDYYFQVTDASGATLLSTDGVEQRRVSVSAGLIVSHSGTHGTGSGRCGDVTVQLFPYEVSPNEGGVYKVWMTPVSRFAAGEGYHGFLTRYSKTDNFKVTPSTPELDTDGDGIPDDEDNCPELADPTNVCTVIID